jgi:hypothetical protein
MTFYDVPFAIWKEKLKKAECGGKYLKAPIWDEEAWTGLMWLRIGAVGRL